MNGDAQGVRWSCRAMLFVLLILSPSGVSAGLETGIKVDFNGQPRWYDLYVPDGVGDQPVPLVIDMHGYSVESDDQRRRSGFRELADSQRFIVAWPQGQGSQWNAAFGAAGTNDVGALRVI
ncbi:MAG: hypothetical protein R3260_19955, partial [Pseudomonas sp.]|nr:hypothetical protein [Pseudomonas sp.]